MGEALLGLLGLVVALVSFVGLIMVTVERAAGRLRLGPWDLLAVQTALTLNAICGAALLICIA